MRRLSHLPAGIYKRKVRINSSPLTGPFTPSTAVFMGISCLISVDSSFGDELEHATSDSANRIAKGPALNFDRSDPVELRPEEVRFTALPVN